MTSDTTTRGIRVQVESRYLEEQSVPEESYYFFQYRVQISNGGDETARLVSRTWIITDADGGVHEVQGPGVVGEQPVLRPGDDFEYTSFCPLKTPVGAMEGRYQMVTSKGESFDAEISAFTLAVPHHVN